MARFTSRKFLLCLAAFLGSIGTSIAALHTDNQTVASVGIVCAILSAAIYAMVEAYVDGKAVNQIEERAFDLDFEDYDADEDEEEDAVEHLYEESLWQRVEGVLG